MSESQPAPKTSGLAITSLVLGIMGFFCLGLLSGVPAIFCGFSARGKIRRSQGSLQGDGLALTGLVMGFLSILSSVVLGGIFAALALPAVSGAVERGHATTRLNDARQIYTAMQMMAADGASGDKKLGLPADAGITSVADLKAALIKGGYLKSEDVERLHFDEFLIGNVSVQDGDDTIVVRSRPDLLSRYLLIVTKDGEGSLYPAGRTPFGVEIRRDPAYLAP